MGVEVRYRGWEDEGTGDMDSCESNRDTGSWYNEGRNLGGVDSRGM